MFLLCSSTKFSPYRGLEQYGQLHSIVQVLQMPLFIRSAHTVLKLVVIVTRGGIGDLLVQTTATAHTHANANSDAHIRNKVTHAKGGVNVFVRVRRCVSISLASSL